MGRLLTGVLIVLILFAGVTSIPGASAADAYLEFDSGQYTAYVNRTVEVTVVLNTTVKLGALQFNVTWNPEYLELVNYSEGAVMSSAMSTLNNGSGFINVGLISVSGVSSGDVMKLTFKAKKEGTTNLNIIIVDASDPLGNAVNVVSGSTVIDITKNLPPVVDLSLSSYEPYIGEVVTFNASAYDPDGYIAYYIWDFGDGVVLNTTDSLVTHAYSTGGLKSLFLTVVDNLGGKTTLTKQIKVMSFKVQLPSGTLRVNKTGEFSIILNTTELLGAVQLQVYYDPSILEVINVSSSAGLLQFHVENGMVSIGIINTNGISSGELAKLTFRGVSNGSVELSGVVVDSSNVPGEKRYGKVLSGSFNIYKRKLGDVNEDDRITAVDALLYLRFAVGLDISPYVIDPSADDINGDGKITAVDALLVLRAAVGLESLEG